MPGVVMCAPMRYTPSMPSVNSTRLRRSETANRFFSAFSMASLPAGTPCRRPRSLPGQDLRRAAGGGDLVGRLAAELVRLHGQLLADIAAGQHLDRLVAVH